jgi:hypothetical protein
MAAIEDVIPIEKFIHQLFENPGSEIRRIRVNPSISSYAVLSTTD